MYKLFRPYLPAFYALFGLGIALVIPMWFQNRTLFYIELALALSIFAAVLIFLYITRGRIRDQFNRITGNIVSTYAQNMERAFMPIITVHQGGEIIWCNPVAMAEVFEGQDVRGTHVAHIFPHLDLTRPATTEGIALTYNEHQYTAYTSTMVQGDQMTTVLYLVDDTNLKGIAREYFETKPIIALIAVDNYDELLQNSKESERAQIMGQLESVIEKYITRFGGFILKSGHDRFLAFLDERSLGMVIGDKFKILEQVRSLHFENRIPATLSIGVGREAHGLYDAENMARQALDMCLGRGGDQVAIKNQAGYEFYGGVSKGVEKRTKVKTRIVATALCELIESSENVIIMGHRFADLDAMGAGTGLLRAIQSMNKPVCVAISRTKNMVGPMLELVKNTPTFAQDYLEPEEAQQLINDKTLLIVVDTHVPHVLESEPLYRACKSVVVIDHHRKMVNHISNAVIFYHEPYASSASEMVTELVQYFPSKPQLTRLDAEALLAGIMLDTKNFVMRTGVRTFEAAAYLRNLGADTVEVRKLFASSMECYQQKAALVATAHVYKSCAIAYTEETSENIRVVAPQAADELMTINGVEASFVAFVTGSVINVSARSLGAVNVQLIMEKLGGGGHLTMAAAQFEEDTIPHILEQLRSAIDEYFTE
ncbi:DHH family phosphoesterase [Oscillospiraceae bacterium MB08-C2-2]|nr:DHH family phosphoesterase [Oscillospiraceae bacterium MB08-C2-2]